MDLPLGLPVVCSTIIVFMHEGRNYENSNTRGLFKGLNERNSRKLRGSFGCKVQWGDMDALQHVNNVVYVRWEKQPGLIILERLILPLEKMKTGIILGFQSVKYILQ
jgi:acyl-ACP thioesterase